MSVTKSETVTINAPFADVLAIIRDPASQPEWFPGTLDAEVLETDADGLPLRVRLVNDVKVAKDEFEVVYTNSDTGVAWKLTAPSKAQKSQEGSWVLVDKGGKTEATLTLDVDSSLPIPGFMQKKAIGDTVKKGVQGLKKRAEG